MPFVVLCAHLHTHRRSTPFLFCFAVIIFVSCVSLRQGHEGPGSLLSYLKEKNWANALGAAESTSTDDFAIFEV